MKLSPSFLAVVALLGAAVTAQAATVTLSNIQGTWYDGNPAANVSYAGNGSNFASANWGGVNPPSGYDFAAAAGSPSAVVPPSPSPNFVIGQFTHRNEPIPSGSSITDIKLKVTADIDVDGTGVGNKAFVFQFSHWETPNGDAPCADGGANGVGVNLNGCADRVTFGFLDASETFLVGSDVYTVNIVGFDVGGSIVNQYWTMEGNHNHADLVARVLLRSDIPEPGVLALVGIGLLGAAAARRRNV